MPRRNPPAIRPVETDPVHRSRLVQQVINKVMQHGKKSTAEQITYDALAIVGERSGRAPVEVPARRARTLAVRWLVSFARNRREKSMSERLANEILDSISQQGGAWKRKDDIYRMAQANKAFAHYRW